MISIKEALAVFDYYKKYFFISLISVFLMVVFQQLRIFNHSIISPLPAKVDIMQSIKPKLEQKKFDGFNLEKINFITSVSAADDFDQAKAYGVIDLNTGEVFGQKNLSKKLPIASLTKIMTAVVALDLASPTDKFRVSKKAANEIPTKLGLIQGQELTLEEALNGMLLVSANDSAEVVAEGVSQKYGEDIFIAAMNEKAKILGLKNTHFQNPQGLDGEDHYSSVEDLASLTKYAITNYPLIKDIVKKDYQFYPANGSHGQIDMYNWNGLLGVYPGAMGVKIGNTEDAGYTTVVLSEREGKMLLAIVLGAPGVLQRDMWASELLDLGFTKLGLSPANITEAQLKAKYSTWKYWN